MSENPRTRVDGGQVSADAAPPPLSRRWRPLWEVELLVSGAVIFSLFRIPGPLRELFYRIENQLSQELLLAPFLVFYLGNLVVLSLIVGFSTHFLLRSFWVALAGLNEVFPEGIRWRALDQSPIQKRLARRLYPSTRELEERVDRVASTVFSVLFFVILQFFFIFVVLGAAMLLLLPLGRLGPELRGRELALAAVGVVYGPLLAAALIDLWFKRRPERIERWPRLAAAVERAFRIYSRLLFFWLYQPIQLTFASHLSSRATAVALSAVMLLVVGLFLVTTLLGGGAVGFDSYTWFPEAGGERAVRPEHYESLAGDGPRAPEPTIQSDVVTGGWVRLFIPYRARRDAERMREVCPETQPPRGEGFFSRRKERKRALPPERRRELLRCIASLYEVELNGEPLAGLDVSFYRHPQSGLRGLLAMIPTAELPRGRNLLVVRQPLSKQQLVEIEEPAELRRELERRTSYIPFWI